MSFARPAGASLLLGALPSLLLLLLPTAAPAETVTQSLVDTVETLQDLSHPCVRDCVAGDSRVCNYTFKVEWYITMSKACHDCPFNVSDCSRPHCAAADGYERALVTVNRRLPGPSLHVCVGDELVVDVVNELGSDSTSIHWHGLHQLGTPYMDGVPFLTQCPIHAGTTFRYHFLADNPGTHYWHSHSGMQRTDGMFGSFVVREPREDDPQKDLYDDDDYHHIFVITDWLDGLGIAKFVNHHHTEHDNKPYNLLINGRGKYTKFERDGLEVYTPVQEYIVKLGRRYRFRALSNSIQNCPIVISIDNHTLVPISTDGSPIQPVEVESLTIYGGERWDFVVNASEDIATYWIKFQGMLDCDSRFKSAYQVAVLRYEGAEGFPGGLEDLDYNSTIREGLQLNKLNAAPGDDTFLTAAEIQAVDMGEDISGTPDHRFWLDFDFYGKNNDLFHHEQYYPFLGVRKQLRLFVPQINEISLKLPNAPPLSQPDDVDYSSFCNATSKRNCQDNFCYCPHVLSVEKDSLVELILVDEGVVYWANHPFHLHGHTFWVLAMGRLGENTTLQKVQELDAAGLIERNFDHPPIKDTVTVPDGGYTIIRFIASNPGYWLFHCHISFHIEVGMGLVFHVGKQSMIPPVPENFPRCGSWTPMPDPNFKSHLANYYKELNEGKISVNLDLLPTNNSKYPGPSYSTPTYSPKPHQQPSFNSINGSHSISSQKPVFTFSYLVAIMFFMYVLI
nr:laccase-4-like isoform X1 [Procambarus clarkii]